MSLISLQNSSELEVTILSNRFIDNFMPRANGEFVKVYIYLLRMVSAAPSSFSLEHMADSLFCTERDISRALKYWEGEKLIALTYTADQKLSGITLLEPFADTGHRESSASVDTFTGSGNSASVSGNADPGVPSSADYILSLTPDRIRELKQNEEISQLLYITEQYLTKTLTPTEMQKILFFYDELHMSADLIEYLVEYCVSRGRKSMRYIDGFDLELIQEACSRTVLSTGQPSFQYADKILSGWKKKNVHTLEDIRLLDAAHKKRQLEKSVSRKKQPQTQPQNSNRFNNFHQRDYDFAEYEKRLLNNQ